MKYDRIVNDNCVDFLSKHGKGDLRIDLSFLDPPFNQGKEYRAVDDNLPDEEYWKFMKKVCKLIYNRTADGGSIYFMQRDKNTKKVMETLEETGTFHLFLF